MPCRPLDAHLGVALLGMETYRPAWGTRLDAAGLCRRRRGPKSTHWGLSIKFEEPDASPAPRGAIENMIRSAAMPYRNQRGLALSNLAPHTPPRPTNLHVQQNPARNQLPNQ